MGRSAVAGRRYWHEVLVAGGSTRLPRWSSNPSSPQPAVVEREIPLDRALVTGLRKRIGELAVPFSSMLLGAHARVVAALCGQPDVVVGYVARGSTRPLPCRLDTRCLTWRALLAESSQVETATLTHRAVDVAELRTQLGTAGPVFETVVDLTGGDGERLAERTDGVALWFGVHGRDDWLALRLRCRGEVWDAEALSRVGDYHLTALRAIAADIDAAAAAPDRLVAL